jgi:hypothetical protein
MTGSAVYIFGLKVIVTIFPLNTYIKVEENKPLSRRLGTKKHNCRSQILKITRPNVWQICTFSVSSERVRVYNCKSFNGIVSREL